MHKTHQQDQAAAGNKPGIGDKMAGGMDKLVGKMSNNPDKVAEGQAKSGSM